MARINRLAYGDRRDAHRKVCRRWRQEHKSEHNAYQRRYRAEHKATGKDAARNTIRQAIYHGKVERPACMVPGCDCAFAEPHHDDYAKPLEVRWLCKGHHRLLTDGWLPAHLLPPIYSYRKGKRRQPYALTILPPPCPPPAQEVAP